MAAVTGFLEAVLVNRCPFLEAGPCCVSRNVGQCHCSSAALAGKKDEEVLKREVPKEKGVSLLKVLCSVLLIWFCAGLVLHWGF